MLALLIAPATLTTDETSLAAAFDAFAACASESARASFEKRMAFFVASGLRSEEEVRKLPEHTAKNEQEQVLALQESLVQPGDRITLKGLRQRTEHNGCSGIVIACLRDGSFRCSVDVDSGCNGAQPAFSARIRIENLRPPEACGLRERSSAEEYCAEFGTAMPPASSSVDDEVVGSTMVRAVHAHEELQSKGLLPAQAASLGESAFPDLPYAALLMVLMELRDLSCYAIRTGDDAGAELAIAKCLELEADARPKEVEMVELPFGIRTSLASLFAISGALKEGQGKLEDARSLARTARLLNTSSVASSRRLRVALSAWQLRAPQATPTASLEDIVRLQRWWVEELLPLDDEEAPTRVPVDAHGKRI